LTTQRQGHVSQSACKIIHIKLLLMYLNHYELDVQGVVMKFPELFYCKHTCVLTEY